MQVKVCGMTRLDQLYALDEMGVQFGGLIFYPKSPRYVFNNGLKAEDVKKAKLRLAKVGVFVNAAYDEVMKAIDDFGLDMAQLHGHETPYQCEKISGCIHLIKAFRFAENDNVPWTIKDYYSDADMFLFDTGVPVSREDRDNPALYGGTGRKFNWNRLKGLNVGKAFFLSGGIEPGDAGLVKDFMKEPVANDLFAVDINSRFEVYPGIKNLQQVKTFIEELNS